MPADVGQRTMEQHFMDAASFSEYIWCKIGRYREEFSVGVHSLSFSEVEYCFSFYPENVMFRYDGDTAIIILEARKDCEWNDPANMYYEYDHSTICDTIMKWAKNHFPSLEASFYEDGVIITASYEAEKKKWLEEKAVAEKAAREKAEKERIERENAAAEKAEREREFYERKRKEEEENRQRAIKYANRPLCQYTEEERRLSRELVDRFYKRQHDTWVDEHNRQCLSM